MTIIAHFFLTVFTLFRISITLGKGMPHTFAMDYPIYPEAENAMNEILTFINNTLDLA